MGKSYQKKTRRSRRKVQNLQDQAVTVDVAGGKASFQMVLPMSPLLSEVAGAIEQTAAQAGLLMMKALIDKEVERIAGVRYEHQADRQATRWGHDEGHVIFEGARWRCPGPASARSKATRCRCSAIRRSLIPDGCRRRSPNGFCIACPLGITPGLSTA